MLHREHDDELEARRRALGPLRAVGGSVNTVKPQLFCNETGSLILKGDKFGELSEKSLEPLVPLNAREPHDAFQISCRLFVRRRA